MKKELSWEYIAGFFDGEGCIFFKKYNSRFVIIHISQGEKNERASGIIKEIYEFLLSNNIDVKFRVRLEKKDKNKSYRVLASAANTCKDWLIAMLPYLRVKKSQAIDAISFIEAMTGKRSSKQIKDIINCRSLGFSIRKIEKELGISKATVVYNLKKYTDYKAMAYGKK